MHRYAPGFAFTTINLVLTLAVWARAGSTPPPAAPSVLRAQSFELVDSRGNVRAQLHLGEDGGGNLRLRDGTGGVRVKLGARQGRTALLLFNEQIEPAVEVMSDAKEGTVLTLTANDRKQRVIRP
jgi:hypothetical protein